MSVCVYVCLGVCLIVFRGGVCLGVVCVCVIFVSEGAMATKQRKN